MKKLTNIVIDGKPIIEAYPSGCGTIEIDFFAGDDHINALVEMEYCYHTAEIEMNDITIYSYINENGDYLDRTGIDFEDAIIDLIAENNIMNDYYNAVNQAASDTQ